MGQSSQTRFDPSDDDRRLFVHLTDEITVYDSGVVRALSHHASRGERICLPPLFGDGVMVHHRIHVAGRHEKAEPGFPELCDARLVLPVRLRYDGHFISVCFQRSRNDRMAKRRVVHIGIPGHIDKIRMFPSPLFHISSADR